jgi:cell division ATPase MinD
MALEWSAWKRSGVRRCNLRDEIQFDILHKRSIYLRRIVLIYYYIAILLRLIDMSNVIRPNIISVVSGKGGVGKTTFSINLSAALNEFDHENVLVDADVCNPNVALHLGLPHMPLTLQDVLNKGVDVNHTIRLHASGLKVVPASLSLDNLRADFSKLKDSLGRLSGTVIVDSPPGLNDDVLSILRASDKVVVVANPEVPAVADAVRTIKIARRMGKQDIGIVINRVRGDFFELMKDEIEIMCETPILAMIHEDGNVRKSIFENIPVVHRNPNSIASIEFMSLAARLAGMDYIPPRFLFIRKILNKIGL